MLAMRFRRVYSRREHPRESISVRTSASEPGGTLSRNRDGNDEHSFFQAFFLLRSLRTVSASSRCYSHSGLRLSGIFPNPYVLRGWLHSVRLTKIFDMLILILQILARIFFATRLHASFVSRSYGIVDCYSNAINQCNILDNVSTIKLAWWFKALNATLCVSPCGSSLVHELGSLHWFSRRSLSMWRPFCAYASNSSHCRSSIGLIFHPIRRRRTR